MARTKRLRRPWKGERWFHAHETARFDTLNGLPLASFNSRAKAYAVDVAIIALAVGLFHLRGHHDSSDSNCSTTVSTTMIKIAGEARELAESVLYFAIALKLGNGQTPGKKLMKIRVVSLTHHGVGWWQSIERALGYGASFLEGGFGFFQYFINGNRMCVHDRIAETIVIDMRRSRMERPLEHELNPPHVGDVPSA